MKIGFFTDSYLPQLNGLTISVEDSARALERRGHEVFIIAPKYPHHKDMQKNVYRLTSIKFVDSPQMRWALELPEKPLLNILRIDFDIIHGHSGGSMTLIGMQIARVKGIPFIITYHTLLSHYTHYFFKGKIVTPKMINIATRLIGNLCDYIIAPSSRAKKELISCGVEKPIYVLPSGIDLKDYKSIEKGFIRNKIKISKDTKILLYVGRLGKEKSVDFLIQSFKLINEKKIQSALVIVGDGPEKNNLKHQAIKLGVEKGVYFLGPIKHVDIPKVYADADVFVFASQTETQGLVVLEALASGIPVIAVKDPTLNDLIVSGKNGYLVKKSPKIFAEKIIKLLNNNKLNQKFSQEAQETAQKFSVEKTAKYLENLYKKLIAKKHKNQRRINFNNSLKTIKEFLQEINNKLKKYYE